MEEGKRYINEEHSVIYQEQDNVGHRVCKGGIPSLIEYESQPKVEVLGYHLLENQQEKQSVLIHISCQRQVGNIMRKRKRAGDCFTEVAS